MSDSKAKELSSKDKAPKNGAETSPFNVDTKKVFGLTAFTTMAVTSN